MGFGTEILFIVFVGLLVLGPKRLHTLMGQVARAKLRFEETARQFKSQVAAEINLERNVAEADTSKKDHVTIDVSA